MVNPNNPFEKLNTVLDAADHCVRRTGKYPARVQVGRDIFFGIREEFSRAYGLPSGCYDRPTNNDELMAAGITVRFVADYPNDAVIVIEAAR